MYFSLIIPCYKIMLLGMRITVIEVTLSKDSLYYWTAIVQHRLD